MSDSRHEPPFIHPNALVETEHVGPGTRIWAFAHVLAGAVIGAGCNICDQVFVDPDVVIGDRVTIKGGAYIVDGMRVEDDVFIGPRVMFTNDRFPRSRQPYHCEATVVGRGASIGAGAIFLPGVAVGEGAMVGAGALVTKDVPPFTVVIGSPARVVREVNDAERVRDQVPSTATSNGKVPAAAAAP